MSKGFEFIGATTVTWILRLIMMIIIFAIVYSIGATMIGIISNTRLAETHIYAKNMLLNPDGIIKVEEGRAYPGVIDCAKLEEKNIKKIISQGAFNEIAANISLLDMDGNLINEVIMNKEYYEIWLELSKTGLFGSQSAFFVEKKRYVLLENCIDKKSGIITIRIVRKKK
jgi:hypothetical protein